MFKVGDIVKNTEEDYTGIIVDIRLCAYNDNNCRKYGCPGKILIEHNFEDGTTGTLDCCPLTVGNNTILEIVRKSDHFNKYVERMKNV